MVTQLFYEPKLVAGRTAKTKYPSLKTLPDKGLTVGRQAEKKTHVPTHTREKQNFADLMQQPLYFKLHHAAERNFIQTVPLLFKHLENLQVVFHNVDYVNAIFDDFQTPHAHLFMEWVKTFAIIRKADREMLLGNVIQSSDDDFLSAWHLFKLQNTKPKLKTFKTSDKIWQVIEKHYADKPFTAENLKNLTLYQYKSLYTHLRHWISEGKLEAVKKPGKRLLYKLLSINQKQL